MTVTIRANDDRNAQVTEEVKCFLYDWYEERGVEDARDRLVFHHYREGDFVATSNLEVSDINALNRAFAELASEYHRNDYTNDDCVWISRYWIEEQMESDREQKVPA